MDSRLTLGVLMLVIGVTFAAPPDVLKFSRDTIDDETVALMDLLRISVKPERYRSKDSFKSLDTPFPRLKAFSYHNCGGNVADLQSLSISPDPIYFPAKIKIGGELRINSTVGSPLKASLTVKKKMGGFWLQIPCIDDFGSCTYEDLCAIFSDGTDCPDPITKSGLGCQCPFKNGNYNIQSISFDVGIADSLPSGDYNVIGTLHHNQQYVSCLNIFITIK